MRIAPTAKSVKQFLLTLDDTELSAMRDYLDGLVEELRQRHGVDIGKRPHMAMPERRQGNRYTISMVGHVHDALSPTPPPHKAVRVIDLSQSGCGLICNGIFYPGQILALAFKSPSGRMHQIHVDVVRTRECSLPGQTIYELGCQIVSPETIEHIREELKHRQAMCELFDQPKSIRIVQLAAGPGSRNVSRFLETARYDLLRVNTAEQIQPTVLEKPTQILIVPADILKGRKPAWLAKLRRTTPQTAIIALAAQNSDTIRLMEMGIDQIVETKDFEAQIPKAVKGALFMKLPWLERHVSQYPMKVLLAGRSERQLRRSETLLLQENCFVAKTRNYPRTMRELQLQRFHIVVFSESLLEETGLPRLEAIRTEHPQIVTVFETDDPNQGAQALAHGADLTLTSTANRGQLTHTIDHAYQIALMREFID